MSPIYPFAVLFGVIFKKSWPCPESWKFFLSNFYIQFMTHFSFHVPILWLFDLTSFYIFDSILQWKLSGAHIFFVGNWVISWVSLLSGCLFRFPSGVALVTHVFLEMCFSSQLLSLSIRKCLHHSFGSFRFLWSTELSDSTSDCVFISLGLSFLSCYMLLWWDRVLIGAKWQHDRSKNNGNLFSWDKKSKFWFLWLLLGSACGTARGTRIMEKRKWRVPAFSES